MEEVIRKDTVIPGSLDGSNVQTKSKQARDQWVAEQMAEQGTLPDERRIVLVASKKHILKMLLPITGIGIAYVLHMVLPNVYPLMYTPMYWAPFLLICAGVYAILYLLGLFLVPVRKKLARYAFLLCFVFLIFEALDIATLKTGTLLLPFIPSPDKVLEQFVFNIETILSASASSLQLLAIGFVVGVVAGLFSGIVSGCSRIAGYWISPLLKIIGYTANRFSQSLGKCSGSCKFSQINTL